MNRILIPLLALLALLLTAQPALAQNGDERQPTGEAPQKTRFPEDLPNNLDILQAMSARALGEQQYDEYVRILEHALQLYPYDHRTMTLLVAGYALQNDKPKAYNLMLIMQRQGIGFDFNQVPQTENIRGTESYEYINNLLIKATEPFVTSETAFTLPESARIAEAIAYDAQKQQFYIGTVREPSILVLDRSGEPRDDAPDFSRHLDYAVFDLTVDAERRHLWASTSAVGQQSGYRNSDYGKNALLQMDLDSGELLQSFQIKPDGNRHGMGNMALASDGTVYLADLRFPGVYRLRPGDEELTILAGGPGLPDIRGIALNEDDGLLYLADKHRGIAFIDLADNKPYMVGVPEHLNLGGIEDLDYWNRHLIMIQPGMRPPRVMQLRLGDGGRKIVASEPKDANHPRFSAPNYGVIAGDRYYYMAASHWSAYDRQGNRLPGTSVDPVPVLAFDLQAVDPAANTPPNLEEILKQRSQQPVDPAPGSLQKPENEGEEQRNRE